MHSFLSQLELQVFFLLDWEDEVVDIREQFPLFPQETTKEICQALGLKHPQEPKAETEMVMTQTLSLPFKTDQSMPAPTGLHSK